MVMSRVSIFIVALVACNEAASLADAVTPVEKVATLLMDLRTKVESEGALEAETYNKYACFCKDTTEEKTQAIEDGENEKDVLQAELNQAFVNREEADTAIAEATKEIGTIEQGVAELQDARHKEALDNDRNEVDLTGAVQALESAIQTLKATKGRTSSAALMQFRSVASNVQGALVMADAMGVVSKLPLRTRAAAAALLKLSELPSEVPESDYEFHGDDIITTLEDLLTQFKEKKAQLYKEETEARHAFEKEMLAQEAALKSHKKAIEEGRRQKADAAEHAAKLSKDLTTTVSQLRDDQQYLMSVSKECSTKAKLWDQRMGVRTNELSTLTGAIDIIKSELLPKSAVLQQRASFASHLRAPPSAKLPASSVASIAARHAVAPHKAAFAARAIANAVASDDAEGGRRAKALALLHARGEQLRSPPLLALTAEAEDPLAKVKQMIQDLVERLLKEAADEANHKGWCDKSIALAEQKRDQSTNSIKELNLTLSAGEARRAGLAEQLQVLDKELKELAKSNITNMDLRANESAENKEAIKDAEDGVEAVTKAIDMLREFYASQKNGAESFFEIGAKRGYLRAKPVSAERKAAPDAGFDEEYTGAQAAQTGVVAMLEVIKSDFEATIKATKEAEAKAEQDHYELETSMAASRAAKETAQSAREAAKQEADAEYTEHTASRASKQAQLDSALGELDSLGKACSGGAMTAEERKAQREDELQALQQALCILDQHGLSGINC